MESDNEEYSEEELIDDQWPDDYFDEPMIEVNGDNIEKHRPKTPPAPPTPPCISRATINDPMKHRPLTPPYASQATFSDLPQHVLRRIVESLGLADRCRLMITCRALKEAVENSRWTNLGNGKLIVTAVDKPTGIIVHVTFGGILIVKSYEEEWGKMFSKLHRTFETLHLQEMQLNNVSLDVPLVQAVNDFLDSGITFDRLTLMRSRAGPISDRQVRFLEEYGLIKRSKRDVIFNVHMDTLTGEQLLSFTQPVTINILKDDLSYWSGTKEEMYVNEEQFVELVRRGHSLVKFRTEFTRMETLASVIETISSSPVPQMCLFRIPYRIGQSYVDAFDAPLMYGPGERCCKHTSYLHLGAKIMLDHSPIPSMRRLFAQYGAGVLPANGGQPPIARPIHGHYHPAVIAVTSRDHQAGPAATLQPW